MTRDIIKTTNKVLEYTKKQNINIKPSTSWSHCSINNTIYIVTKSKYKSHLFNISLLHELGHADNTNYNNPWEEVLNYNNPSKSQLLSIILYEENRAWTNGLRILKELNIQNELESMYKKKWAEYWTSYAKLHEKEKLILNWLAQPYIRGLK